MAAKKDPRRRILRASKDATASLDLSNSFAKLVGNEHNFVAVGPDGIYLKGNISIITDGLGTRKGGLFVGTPDLLRMIPSTIVTPIPPHLPIPPVTLVGSIVKDLAFFLALLA